MLYQKKCNKEAVHFAICQCDFLVNTTTSSSQSRMFSNPAHRDFKNSDV